MSSISQSITDHEAIMQPIDRSESDSGDDDALPRSLSPLAVLAALFALLSLLIYFDPFLAFLPLIAIVAGVRARLAVRARRDELKGAELATGAAAVGAFLLVAGITFHTVRYLTEVPQGFDRATFELLQPDPMLTTRPIPATAQAMEGKPIFIKGYIHPSAPQRVGMDGFLLVRDTGDCCFSDPKITHKIAVKLSPDKLTNFTGYMVKVTGIFHVVENPNEKVWYYLSQAEVR